MKTFNITIKDLLLEVEMVIFKLTRIELPTLRSKWLRHVEDIQYQLDLEHGTNYSIFSQLDIYNDMYQR